MLGGPEDLDRGCHPFVVFSCVEDYLVFESSYMYVLYCPSSVERASGLNAGIEINLKSSIFNRDY